MKKNKYVFDVDLVEKVKVEVYANNLEEAEDEVWQKLRDYECDRLNEFDEKVTSVNGISVFPKEMILEALHDYSNWYTGDEELDTQKKEEIENAINHIESNF